MHPSRSILCGSLAVTLLLGCFFIQNTKGTYVYPGDQHVGKTHKQSQSIVDIEQNMRERLVQVIGNLVSPIMHRFSTIRLSTECDDAVLEIFRAAFSLEDWAIKMVDAMGKPSAGILEGTAAALGDYDECLVAEMPLPDKKSNKHVVKGQYCMLKIDIPDVLRQAAMDYQAGNRSSSYLANTKTFFRNMVKMAPRADIADMRLGICVPSACSIADLEVMISTFAGGEVEMVKFLRCEVKEDMELEVEQIAIMVFLGIVAFLVLTGTLIDFILRSMASGPVDDVFFKKQNMPIQLLVSFSWCNNFRKLAKLEMEDGHLSCVRGIKFLSMCLVIVVSTYAMPVDLHFIKYRSAFNIFKFMDQWWFASIANSSAGIDTLFFLAGLQITYKIWKKASENSENKVSVNIFRLLIVWYSRLTFSQLLVIALFLMFPVIGSGPLWGDLVVPEVEHCKSTWWMNVLCINNFWPANETCLFHTWFVTALMQMLIFTPFILWILNRWNVFGILLILSLTLGSCIAVAMVTMANALPPGPAVYFISFLNLRMIWDKMFIQAYDHVASFCVGILMGYILARNPKVELRKFTAIIGWSAAAACNLSILFGLYCYRHGDTMEPALAAFYASAHRLGWSLGIAWIVFACAYGYGGPISDFLSWKVFIPLERLSNFIYLLHPLVIFFHTGQIRERMFMSHLDQGIYYSAYIFLTCILAAVCYVTFVVPYRFIESTVWKDRVGGSDSHKLSTVSKVIAIKERITNDFNITMRDSSGERQPANNVGGIDNNGFST